MTTPDSRRVILDTSVLVASDADLSDLICQISSASYAELHFGVHGAADEGARLSRQHRLTMIQSVTAKAATLGWDTRIGRRGPMAVLLHDIKSALSQSFSATSQ